MDFKVGIGTSQNKDPLIAGQEATSTAINTGKLVKANFLIVFGSLNYDQQQLIEGISKVTSAPLIGGSTTGEISNLGFSQNSVVVVAIESVDIHFNPIKIVNLGHNENQIGEQIAKEALENISDQSIKKTLLIFSDGLTINADLLMSRIQDSLGAGFEIAGGALGDEMKFEKSYQYCNNMVNESGVTGATIFGDYVTSFGISTGWQSVGNRIQCTKSTGREIFELGGSPALDIYRQYLGPERSTKLPAVGLKYPWGVVEIGEDGKQHLKLKIPIAIDENKNSIKFSTAIPEGSTVTLVAATRSDVIRSVEEAAKQAKESLKGAKPLLILFFCSLGNKAVMGERSGELLDVIKNILGNQIPLAGFYSLGEIGPDTTETFHNPNYTLHNQTSCIWILGTNLFSRSTMHGLL